MDRSKLPDAAKTGILFFLILSLVLTACSSEGEEPKNNAAMGRYVEEALPLPEELAGVLYLGLNSAEKFLLIGRTGSDEKAVWISHDDGETWQRESPPWLPLLDEYEDIYDITLDEKDRIWLTYAAEDEGLENYEDAPGRLVMLEGNTAVQQEITLRNGDTTVAQNILVCGNEIAADFGRGIGLYDLSAGKEILSINQERYLQQGDYILEEDVFALTDGDSLKLFDTKNGKPLAEIPVQKSIERYQQSDFFDMDSNRTVITSTPQRGVYSYCNRSGIYRVSDDGLIHEKVLTGDLSSLVMPTYAIKTMFATEDSYFVYVTNKESMPWNLIEPTLLRYRYDADAATVPATELKIYSLYDSPTVRQAAGVFQRQYPDVRVYFEAVLAEESGMQKQDALRALTTELLAGNGPDVLVLDGLPVESYVEKGVLLDLSGVIQAASTGNLLGNILDSYQIDNKRYAIPARFSIPMVLTDEETLGQITSLRDLADYLGGLESPQTGTLPGELFDLLYPLYCREWFYEDGTLNPTAASEGLSDIKRILDLYEDVTTDEIWNTHGDFRVWSIGWLEGWTPFSLGNLTAIDQLSGPYTVLQDKEGIFSAYPSVEEAVIYPQAIVGVNAAGDKQELALQFVECLLSDSVQSQILGDGMPVSKSAIAANQGNPYVGEYQRFGVSFNDGFQRGTEKSRTIPMYWPDRAYFENFFKDIENIEARSNTDDSLKEIVGDEARRYFSGEISLETAVSGLKQKVGLYQAE